jgi:hypothetical protein
MAAAVPRDDCSWVPKNQSAMIVFCDSYTYSDGCPYTTSCPVNRGPDRSECENLYCDRVCKWIDPSICARECEFGYYYDPSDDKGDCPEDEIEENKESIEYYLEECKADEDFCDGCLGEVCKAAWGMGRDDTEETNCLRDICDKVCDKNHFGWCGLSAGAIAGIVIAVLVVVGGIAGVLVFFLVIRKKSGDE